MIASSLHIQMSEHISLPKLVRADVQIVIYFACAWGGKHMNIRKCEMSHELISTITRLSEKEQLFIPTCSDALMITIDLSHFNFILSFFIWTLFCAQIRLLDKPP